MTYTGNLKRTQGRTEDALPLGHPEYAEQHMAPGRDERIGARPPYAAPRTSLATPPGLTDSGTAYDAVLPAEAPPGLTSDEPDGHDIGEPTPAGAGRSYEGSRDAGNRARSQDRNAGRSRLLRPLEHDDGHRQGERQELGRPGDAGRTRALRGRNSLPENNPDGDGAGGPVRQGYRVRRWYDRRIRQRGQLRHELRIVRDKLADSAMQSPPLAIANRYTSPFAQIQSGRKRTQQGPMIRRTPRPWDEEAVAAAAAETDYSAAGQGLHGWGL